MFGLSVVGGALGAPFGLGFLGAPIAAIQLPAEPVGLAIDFGSFEYEVMNTAIMFWIAGIILTIGMAVDANVLIFERFRENVQRGKSVPYALEGGFKEAWDSIRAANVSSLITALILFGFGTSIVRGFAVTFSIGIILSMITAVTLTRTLMKLVLASDKTHHPALLAAKPKNK